MEEKNQAKTSRHIAYCPAGSGVGTHSRMLTNSPTVIFQCTSFAPLNKLSGWTRIASRWNQRFKFRNMHKHLCSKKTPNLTKKQLVVMFQQTGQHELIKRSMHWFKAGSLPPKGSPCDVCFCRHPLSSGVRSGNASQQKQ